MKAYIHDYEIRLSNMKRFSVDQQDTEDHEPSKHGKGNEKSITLVKATVNKEYTVPPKVSKRLIQGWEEYVYAERIRNRLYGRMANLANDECLCGKGKMTYPHWPPTSRNEALALLNNCLKEDNIHRKYIAYCWWVFANSMATMKDWPSQSKQEPYAKLANMIRSNCPAVVKELKPNRKIPPRPADWSCQKRCERYLRERDGCTCFCEWHQEECLTHKY
jgi:hypothetical protein